MHVVGFSIFILMRFVHNTNDQYTLISCVELTILNSWQQRPLLIRLDVCRGRLKCDGRGAETRFRLSAKRTSPLKLAGASVQSTTGSRGVHISGSNAGCTMFRGSVKGTCYPLHSLASPSLPLPCVTVCHHISTGVYKAMTTAHALRLSQCLCSRFGCSEMLHCVGEWTVLCLTKDRCALFWVNHTKTIFC